MRLANADSFFAVLDRHPDTHRALVGVLERVVNQVDQDLLEPECVAGDRRQPGLGLEPDFDAFLAGPALEYPERVLRQRGEIHRLGLQGRPVLEPGEQQQVRQPGVSMARLSGRKKTAEMNPSAARKRPKKRIRTVSGM
jgi:hypothetical protein